MMVKHLVSWKFKPEVSDEQKAAVAAEFNERLQAVKAVAEGVVDVKVIAPPLPTSSADIVLDSTFVSAEALAAYQVHPGHVEAVGVCVKPYLTDRTCCDYECE
ncbi:Dabb family protein [Lacrimispora sp. NSJ-141]|uniref:Dabb family protein n=1 Tax=Lientehia hominis TaxID=2897778 RepID=A0AAP2W926_9FIRM|nr:Dabb family protein [Lientehia hominis]MCD2491244.1 Dabb family protein [Lientehia hominis]